MDHPAGAADIFTTEYMDQRSEYDRACSLCSSDESKPLLIEEDDDDLSKQLGRGRYPRLVSRSGETNVVHFDTRSRKIFGQMSFMFHVLIGMRAWKLVILFFLSYVVSYFVIGAVLWFTHDMSEFHGIHTYLEAVVFTGYTMTTVGFGNQYPKHPESSIIPLLSVVFSLLMDAFWLGVIFARIASPRPLRHTVLFSKQGVLYNNEQSCYTFACRMINLRLRYPWVDLSAKMTLSTYDTATDSIVMEELKVVDEAMLFFDIPWEIKHQITNDSPLLPLIMAQGSFDKHRGEIIVELNGQDPLTGNCMKKRFSYCAHEILRDYGFVGIVSSPPDGSGYRVDLTRFHNVTPSIIGQGSKYGVFPPAADSNATPKVEVVATTGGDNSAAQL